MDIKNGRGTEARTNPFIQMRKETRHELWLCLFLSNKREKTIKRSKYSRKKEDSIKNEIETKKNKENEKKRKKMYRVRQKIMRVEKENNKK